MHALLRQGTTYQPFGFSERALRFFRAGDYRPLRDELASLGGLYERVAVDRALAIAIDLALLGVSPGASLLDVGCSVGTVARLLSELGYMATGIDSDVVARVQDWQQADRIAEARLAGASCQFFKRDLREHLDATPDRYDVVVMLSVLHHWLAGYQNTGTAQFDRAEVRETLERLVGRVRRHLYLELPIGDEREEAPPDPEGEFLFPGWFLERRLVRQITFVASTIASNGKPRRLYRLDVA